MTRRVKGELKTTFRLQMSYRGNTRTFGEFEKREDATKLQLERLLDEEQTKRFFSHLVPHGFPFKFVNNDKRL